MAVTNNEYQGDVGATNGGSNEHYVRPVFYLKSALTIKGGSGSADAPFIIADIY